MNRLSKYYPGTDGTRLAADIYLPDDADKTPVPVIMKAGYAPRRQAYAHEKAAIDRFVADGYGVAIVEVRGAGASFGVSDGFFGPKDGDDLAAVIEGLAKEPWCTGRIGTYGGSNYGMSQEITLTRQPEALKVSLPCDCSMDFYDQDYPNGASALPEMAHGSADPNRRTPDNDPVDADTDGSLLSEAARAHERNLPFLAQHVKNMFRDDPHPLLNYRPNLDVPAWERMEDVRHGHVAVASLGAWFDPGATNKILTWNSWGGHLLIGPWMHTGIYRQASTYPEGNIDWIGYHEKHFDRYLKGLDNDLEQEPPVRYYTIGERASSGHSPWKYDADFPVAGTTFPKLYLDAGHAGPAANVVSDVGPAANVASDEDCARSYTLSENQPEAQNAASYQVRNDINYYGPFGRMNRDRTDDLRSEDAKSLVFTGAPLPADLELTGVPTADLYVTSTHPDGNFLAVLEAVTPDGESHFLTEGVIRASHAKTHMNPVYASLGLPYHRGYREDAVRLSEETPLLLSFHLEALSRIIPAGCRLQLSISCGGSGYQQPEGFPGGSGAQQPEGLVMPVIRLWTGAKTPSCLTLPVIAPTVTTFSDVMWQGKPSTVYVFKRGIYIHDGARFTAYPCLQVYPKGAVWSPESAVNGQTEMVYETEALTATVSVAGGIATLTLQTNTGRGAGPAGAGTCPDEAGAGPGEACVQANVPLPLRYTFGDTSGEIPLPRTPWSRKTERRAAVRNLYVATVPVSKGVKGNMNPMMRSTFDLFIDLEYPDGHVRKDLPCIVNIHGFGGSHHQFENTTEGLLLAGYAVASVDYRLTPPETWEAPCADVRGCIRYLKAHARELGLDPERFGVTGGSMGGYLAAMMSAVNGDPAEEGAIGGNPGRTSALKAGAAYFAPTDILHFGDDCTLIWPSQPDKAANGDGGFAPPASMTGHIGYGKGMADLKAHAFDQDPEYVRLREITRRASPISYVHAESAPLCLVHGIYDCGIQVPMGQSLRMFEAYTRKGVKSLLLCNNNGFFGDDPEVRQAVIDFFVNRV